METTIFDLLLRIYPRVTQLTVSRIYYLANSRYEYLF